MNNTVLQEFVEQTYLDFLKEEEARELESIQKDYDKLLEQFSALAEYAQFDKLLEATTIDVEQLSKQVGTLKDIFGALASFAPKKAEFPEYAQTGPACAAECGRQRLLRQPHRPAAGAAGAAVRPSGRNARQRHAEILLHRARPAVQHHGAAFHCR